MLTDEQLTTIVHATARPLVTKLDRLRTDLDWVATWHAHAVALSPGSLTRRRSLDKRVSDYLRKAEMALVELGADGQDRLDLVRSALDATTAMLHPTALAPVRRTVNDAVAGKITFASPFEIVVSRRLVCVFEKNFRLKAGIGRTKEGDLTSPYLRFAHQSLIELGILTRDSPYKMSAIAAAFSDVRRGVRRRRSAKEDEIS